MPSYNQASVDRELIIYTVQKGDNWFRIAEQLYGDMGMTVALMRANPGISALSQGQVLRLPNTPASDVDATESVRDEL